MSSSTEALDKGLLAVGVARALMQQTTADDYELRRSFSDEEEGEQVEDPDDVNGIQPPSGNPDDIPMEHFFRRSVLNETLETVAEMEKAAVLPDISTASGGGTISQKEIVREVTRRSIASVGNSLKLGRLRDYGGLRSRRLSASFGLGGQPNLPDLIADADSLSQSGTSNTNYNNNQGSITPRTLRDNLRKAAAAEPSKCPFHRRTSMAMLNTLRNAEPSTTSASISLAAANNLRRRSTVIKMEGPLVEEELPLSVAYDNARKGNKLDPTVNPSKKVMQPDFGPDGMLGTGCVKHLDDRWKVAALAVRDSIYDPENYDDGSFGPLYIRNCIHSCATYEPMCPMAGHQGGIVGACMRFRPELTDAHNRGLKFAHQRLNCFVRESGKAPWISNADLFVLAAYVTIECGGGPVIKMEPGRRDSNGRVLMSYKEAFDVGTEDEPFLTPEGGSVQKRSVWPGRLPMGEEGTLGGMGKVGNLVTPEHEKEELTEKVHDLYNIFTKRMGIPVRYTMALISGGHAFGRCHNNISGYAGPWQSNPGCFNNLYCRHLLYDDWKLVDKFMEDKSGDLITGVCPRGIRRQYVNKNGEGDIMMLVSDMSLKMDYPNYGYRFWLEKYAKDTSLLAEDFGYAFKVATELGWTPPSAPYRTEWGRKLHEAKVAAGRGLLALVDHICGTSLDEERKRRAAAEKARKELALKNAAPKTGKPFTMAEVERHNKESDMWVAINGQVINLTNFKDKHPGGVQILVDSAGKDVSAMWNTIHCRNAIDVAAPETIIGHVID